MELRQLEYFCAVSSLENFTKAAHFLHVSQPSVTKAIQALEAELNLTLFDRSQKHIALTEAGQVFLIHAKKILQDVQTANLGMERFKKQNGGVIRFGVPPMVESYLLPKLFMKFRDANPDIILDVQECKNSNDVQEKIDQDFLDFGIIFLHVDENLKNSLQLFEDKFYLCVSQNHKFANEQKISFDSLKGEKFIVQPTGTVQHFVTMKSAAESGFSPEILLSTSQMKTLTELVSYGAEVTILPKFVMTDSPNFKAVPIEPPLKFKVSLAWNKLKDPSPLGERFLKFFNELLQSQEVTP